MTQEPEHQPWWKRFRKPIAISLGLMVLGAAGLGTAQGVLSYTNTVEFCVSCHSMADTPMVEWQQSAHFLNPSGVRAGCPDCHVPTEIIPMIWRKIEAVNDVWHHVAGTVDTPEQFEERRLLMAQREWRRMEANDSMTCRSCHAFEAMDFTKHTIRGEREMRAAQEEGKTCIECHRGIAHRLPAGLSRE